MNCIIFCCFQLCKLLCLPMYTTNISMKSAFSQKKRPNLFFSFICAMQMPKVSSLTNFLEIYRYVE